LAYNLSVDIWPKFSIQFDVGVQALSIGWMS